MQHPQTILSIVLGIGLFGLTLTAAADNVAKAKTTKVAFVPSERTIEPTKSPLAGINENDDFVFGAPPGNNYAEAVAVYQPIADYLSRATGMRFTFRYSDNWLSYSKDMANGSYDLVFDGAVTNGWRQNRMNHTPLVKLSEDLTFVTIARKDNPKLTTTKHLAGQKICAHAPTDPEMVALLAQFDNPSRQPVIIETKGWDNAYQGLLAGKCAATVIPLKHLQKNDRGQVNVLQQHRPMPSHALSAGPRISSALQHKIREALLTGEGKSVTAKLRASFGDDNWVAADPAEYVNLGKLLKDNLYLY